MSRAPSSKIRELQKQLHLEKQYGGELFRVWGKWAFTAQESNQLSFAFREELSVVDTQHTDWWMAVNKAGKKGLVPKNYIERTDGVKIEPVAENAQQTPQKAAEPATTTPLTRDRVKGPSNRRQGSKAHSRRSTGGTPAKDQDILQPGAASSSRSQSDDDAEADQHAHGASSASPTPAAAPAAVATSETSQPQSAPEATASFKNVAGRVSTPGGAMYIKREFSSGTSETSDEETERPQQKGGQPVARRGTPVGAVLRGASTAAARQPPSPERPIAAMKKKGKEKKGKEKKHKNKNKAAAPASEETRAEARPAPEPAPAPAPAPVPARPEPPAARPPVEVKREIKAEPAPPAPRKHVLRPGVTLHLASTTVGVPIMAAEDEYVKNLAPWELSARCHLNRPAKGSDYLTMCSASVLEWTDDDAARLAPILADLAASSLDLNLAALPSNIYFIKSTGEEEANQIHCRGTIGIVIPAAALVPPRDVSLVVSRWTLFRSIAQALFHVLSRNMPVPSRTAIYNITGFLPLGHKCELPEVLMQYRVTDPDSVSITHGIALPFVREHGVSIEALIAEKRERSPVPTKYDGNGKLAMYVPVQHAKTRGSVPEGKPWTDYVGVHYIPIWKVGSKWTVVPNVLPYSADNLPREFWRQVGNNTDYVRGPEAAVADAFGVMLQRAVTGENGDNDGSTPSLNAAINRLRRLLTGSDAAGRVEIKREDVKREVRGSSSTGSSESSSDNAAAPAPSTSAVEPRTPPRRPSQRAPEATQVVARPSAPAQAVPEPVSSPPPLPMKPAPIRGSPLPKTAYHAFESAPQTTTTITYSSPARPRSPLSHTTVSLSPTKTTVTYSSPLKQYASPEPYTTTVSYAPAAAPAVPSVTLPPTFSTTGGFSEVPYGTTAGYSSSYVVPPAQPFVQSGFPSSQSLAMQYAASQSYRRPAPFGGARAGPYGGAPSMAAPSMPAQPAWGGGTFTGGTSFGGTGTFTGTAGSFGAGPGGSFQGLGMFGGAPRSPASRTRRDNGRPRFVKLR